MSLYYTIRVCESGRARKENMQETDSPVSIFVEIPETLHNASRMFLDDRPDWDADRLATAAMSLFLMQHAAGSIEGMGRIYLESLFPGGGLG